MLSACLPATGSAPAPKTILQVTCIFFRIGQLVPEVVEVPLTNHIISRAAPLTGLNLHLVLGEFVAIVKFQSHCKNVWNDKLYPLLGPEQPNIAKLIHSLLQPQVLYALNIVVQGRDHIVPELHEHHHARYRKDIEQLVGLLHVWLRNCERFIESVDQLALYDARQVIHKITLTAGHNYRAKCCLDSSDNQFDDNSESEQNHLSHTQ